jgi:hypothetical protein
MTTDVTFTGLTASFADRYRVERELGAGGMATVYLARDLKHDRDVAIKVLHPDLGAALGGERFLTEIRTTARLQHPHILPLLDSGEADGQLYYVMPLVAGETLRARLERETVVVHQPERVLALVTALSGAAERLDWDFYPDGGRIVFPQTVVAPQAPADTTASVLPARFVVVLNWFEELKAKTKP